jgi:hypothetical protein
MDLDGCTITQSSASSRPLELLVARWSEDRLGAAGHSNIMYHLSVSYSRLLQLVSLQVPARQGIADGQRQSVRFFLFAGPPGLLVTCSMLYDMHGP